MPSLDVIDERTNKNTENVDKIFKCLFGSNSSGGVVGDMKTVKTNIAWFKWLAILMVTTNVSILIIIIRLLANSG